MVKKILIALLAILVIIQFIRPAKNNAGDTPYAIATKYEVPEDVASLMKVACNDCHTNNTRYPWYANIQPTAWWLASHVKEGKEHLNFSEFTNRRIAWQYHKFEETIEMVKEKEMPLPSYTWMGLHAEAKLSDEQRASITLWAQKQMDMLAATYPADSLVMKRR
jgi:hypothetical protein